MTTANRKAPCRCGSGKQYRACCLQRDRALEDGAAAAREAHRTVDGVVHLVVSRVEAEGRPLACRVGCTQCCRYIIRTSRVEALPIAAYLLEPSQAGALARFAAAYPRWQADSGPGLVEMEAMLRRHGGAPEGDGEEAQRWYQLADEVQRREAVCPLLDGDGRCAVHPVRPVVCRAWNVTGTAENCRLTSPTPAAVVEDPALDEAVIGARLAMLRAGRNMTSPDDAALPTQVARALDDLAPAGWGRANSSGSAS